MSFTFRMTSRFSKLIQILIVVVVVKAEGKKLFGRHVGVRAELLTSRRNAFNVEDEWTKKDDEDETKFWQHSWWSFSLSSLTLFFFNFYFDTVHQSLSWKWKLKKKPLLKLSDSESIWYDELVAIGQIIFQLSSNFSIWKQQDVGYNKNSSENILSHFVEKKKNIVGQLLT